MTFLDPRTVQDLHAFAEQLCRAERLSERHWLPQYVSKGRTRPAVVKLPAISYRQAQRLHAYADRLLDAEHAASTSWAAWGTPLVTVDGYVDFLYRKNGRRQLRMGDW